MNKKWLDFLFDVFSWCTHALFQENYVTELEVNCQGKGEIYAVWHMTDQYQGRYRSRNLTCNIVDINITILDANVIISEHLCYKYFRRSKGSLYTLVPDLLKQTLANLYEKYFVDMILDVAAKKIHFMCAYCSHEEDERPEDRHVRCIPKWYLKQLYAMINRVSRLNPISLEPCASEMSCYLVV